MAKRNKYTYPKIQQSPYSVFKPIQAGFFRQKLTIQRPVHIMPDGQGGVNEQWADLATVWGRIQTIGTNTSSTGNIEKFEEQKIQFQEHYHVMIRWGTTIPIDNSYRILYTSPANNNITKILEIIAVTILDNVNWQIRLYCREAGNIG